MILFFRVHSIRKDNSYRNRGTYPQKRIFFFNVLNEKRMVKLLETLSFNLDLKMWLELLLGKVENSIFFFLREGLARMTWIGDD